MQSTLQKAEDAYHLYENVVKIVQAQQLAGVVLGSLLYKLKANNTFKKSIGAGIETWNDFLKLPEISLEVREANRAIELYETFVVKYGYTMNELAEAKIKSLHYLLPLAKVSDPNDQSIRELVEDAKHLTQNQFRESLFDARNTDKINRSYQFVLMRKCIQTGTLQKVTNVSHETIVEAFKGLSIDLDTLFLPEIL